MPRLLVVRKRREEQEEESRDVYELASDAADALETYRRAPWTQINDRVRLESLERAIHLLQRAYDIETGKIPQPIWGDM
jgi:hypothetical protein